MGIPRSFAFSCSKVLLSTSYYFGYWTTTMSKLSDTKGEDWEQLASGYEKMTYQTSKAPISKMLERAHALASLSRATGILDNGCGPGPIMSRIIDEYGSGLPDSCSLTCADFS